IVHRHERVERREHRRSARGCAARPPGMLAHLELGLERDPSGLRRAQYAPPGGAPPVRQACSLTLNAVSSVIRPAFNSRNTMASVISLLMLAGGASVSASFSKRTRSASASMRMARFALVSNPAGGGAA